jgi:peptidoglycan/LPS O-acetylase OafA/YrhL
MHERLIRTAARQDRADDRLVEDRRVAALDGLRGIAALIVVVFHFLCLLYPAFVPDMSDDPHRIADTPLGLLWNGPFAVSLFFVLSGFVMAGAADRRRALIVSNFVTRYLRLALPVLASVVFAWLLLSAFPQATADLGLAMAEPSRWLNYTYQHTIPPLYLAVADGLAGNFLRGKSGFNNVLWTMQIELVGSLGLFVLYWLSGGRIRVVMLLLGGVAILSFARDAYLGFVLGALLYEARKAGLLRAVPAVLPAFFLVAGLLLGAPGRGTPERWGLPEMPVQWTIGHTTGVVPVLAAALILLATLTLPRFSGLLAHALPRWLGRISFSLYLVHVPLLYTLVAYAYVQLPIDPALLAILYFSVTLLLAHAFTLAFDEPTLRLLRPVRNRLQPFEMPFLSGRQIPQKDTSEAMQRGEP